MACWLPSPYNEGNGNVSTAGAGELDVHVQKMAFGPCLRPQYGNELQMDARAKCGNGNCKTESACQKVFTTLDLAGFLWYGAQSNGKKEKKINWTWSKLKTFVHPKPYQEFWVVYQGLFFLVLWKSRFFSCVECHKGVCGATAPLDCGVC